MKRFKIISSRNYSTRTVKRTYWSKKKHKFVTKTYKYKRYKNISKTTRSDKLIVRNGKLTEYGKAFKNELAKNLSESYVKDIESYISEKKQLKESTLLSHIEGVHYEQAHKDELGPNKSNPRRFIYNMGGDIDVLAEEMGISQEELLNEKNWRFISPEEAYFTLNGYEYNFHFKYSENSIVWQRRKLK